jgi:hypothetical protein
MPKTPKIQAKAPPRVKTSQPAAPGNAKRGKAGTVAKVPNAAGKKKSPKPTRAETLIALMRKEGGATAQGLAEAVGWQPHSVRGFISGTLKKRSDLDVQTSRIDRITHYSVRDRAATKR